MGGTKGGNIQFRNRGLNKLSAVAVRAAMRPGNRDALMADGGGLFLRVRANSAAFLFRYHDANGRREVGIGPAKIISLEQARAKAAELRARAIEGALVHHAVPSRPNTEPPDFRTAFLDLVSRREPNWRNAKHSEQWRSSVFTHAADLLPLRVDQITGQDIVRTLEPIWLATPETARRLRQRIEAVLSFATAMGWRSGANPASLRNGLDYVLPRQPKQTRHHAALPVEEAPAAFERLWERRSAGVSVQAVIIVALTALRSGEVRHLQRGDVDEARIEIPAARMKANRPHRVPLSTQAKKVLDETLAIEFPRSELVLTARSGKALSDMSLSMAQRRAGITTTVHGWRSTFRDWCTLNNIDRDVAEDALSHVWQASATEAAYARHDLFERRIDVMTRWANFLSAGVKP